MTTWQIVLRMPRTPPWILLAVFFMNAFAIGYDAHAGYHWYSLANVAVVAWYAAILSNRVSDCESLPRATAREQVRR